MQPSVLRALEFDRVRDALASLASTPLGRARAAALIPTREMATVRAALDATTEALTFTARGSLDLDAPEDLEPILAGLDLGDQPLEPTHLLGLSRLLESVEQAADRIRRTQDAFPHLSAIADRATSFAEERAAVRRAIDAAGDVVDDASPALRDIRDQLRRARGKLRSTLDGLARGRDTAKYLQDQIVTDRNGRYVLVLRAEHRDALPGIVHGSSASGASLYVEPLATVALNNEVVALAEREKAEVFRILLALTNAFRTRADELDAMLDVAAELDELAAKAALARRLDGIAPAVISGGGIEFRGARHPLLIPAVRDLLDADQGGPNAPVPSDLLVVPPARALVISGPNTGGKTVALKAIGLLSLMAQAGLLIPVEPGSRFTPFRTVFADIGDEQSISASLSTFSARIANLVAMDRAIDPPALVLLDELGGGTDPAEGGALGAAVIDHFRARGAIVVATTHDDALKSYAATTEGVTTAGFGFDPATYAPTYRLIYGAPGRSLALEIAARLGMPASVIADARARRSGRESLLAEHLARVDEQLAGLDRDRLALETDRAALAAERERLLERETRLTEREAVLRKRLESKLTEQIRTARAEVDAVVTRLRQKADALATSASRAQTSGGGLSTGDIGGLRAEARSALEAIERANDPQGGAEHDQPLDTPPDAGDRVYVATLGAEGVVTSVSSRDVEVDVRGKRLRVRLRDLRRRPPAGAAAAGRGASKTPDSVGRRGGVSVSRAATPTASAAELVLIGATVDAALDRAEKFLDDALLGETRRLRVVHGHGTGRLREALRQFFRQHPMIASVSPAPANEGGDGATIVELKE